jgi:putative FmdB family regulatory protein
MIYPYKCTDCSTEFTVEMSLEDYIKSPEIFCPRCMSEDVKRTFYSMGIHFKDKDFTKYVREEE